jgi:hypothetical protein
MYLIPFRGSDMNLKIEIRKKEWNHMKKVLASLCLLLGASMAFAQTSPSTVRWQTIVGVITPQNVNNPVGNGINSGTFAWSTRSGAASVNLETGAASFHVEGLVINGTSFSGTPGPITKIEGTLVCNAGTDQQSLHDTLAVRLDAQGNAQFTGTLGTLPAGCGNPLFLLRIFDPSGARGLWIATGAVQSLGM